MIVGHDQRQTFVQTLNPNQTNNQAHRFGWWAGRCLRLKRSRFDRLSDPRSIVDVNAKAANRAFQFGVPEQQLGPHADSWCCVS
ncbi:hypothetical protein Thiowin_00656 [Thiorhodovibrio winogradskyi]|uniref:Uncharacterized protein n=1 Tax=Thiorhodovibrio winogradskyi TaxID=77007 RepID=A0ABZ0S583_9GAMM